MKPYFLVTVLLLSTILNAREKRESLRKLSTPNGITTEYVHSWKSFPTITGRFVHNNEKVSLSAKKGEALVAVFIASWCLPCQKLINDFKSIEKKFENRHTKFLYIFAHDTRDDAQGFKKAYKIGNNAILANVKVMKEFRQPELPSIYVADRQSWMIWRSINVKKQDLGNLDEFLEYHTAN